MPENTYDRPRRLSNLDWGTNIAGGTEAERADHKKNLLHCCTQAHPVLTNTNTTLLPMEIWSTYSSTSSPCSAPTRTRSPWRAVWKSASPAPLWSTKTPAQHAPRARWPPTFPSRHVTPLRWTRRFRPRSFLHTAPFLPTISQPMAPSPPACSPRRWARVSVILSSTRVTLWRLWRIPTTLLRPSLNVRWRKPQKQQARPNTPTAPTHTSPEYLRLCATKSSRTTEAERPDETRNGTRTSSCASSDNN